MRKFTVLMMLLVVIAAMTGCSGNKDLMAQQEQDLADLQANIDVLENSLETEEERSAKLNADLEEALAELEESEMLFLKLEEDLATITIPDAVTFASSSTRVTKEGKDILEQIWDVLSDYQGYVVMVEGHTDDVQIAERFTGRYASNWELSSARAHAVVHYLTKKQGADPERLSAIGYGEYQPVADNTTPEGRAENRRVVIAVRAKR